MDAIASARQAVKYDPNYADGYGQLANVLAYAGEGVEAVQLDLVAGSKRSPLGDAYAYQLTYPLHRREDPGVEFPRADNKWYTHLWFLTQ